MNGKFLAVAFGAAALIGCARNQAPDVAGQIRNSLRQGGLNSVTVSQDRGRGVVTLGGSVAQPDDKARAAQIAQPLAQGEVVANQIAVLPNGYQSEARNVDSDLDRGIQANLDAALTQANLGAIHHATKNGVVTLTGSVDTPQTRTQAAQVAAQIPNVQQVVNEIDVKNWRATTTNPNQQSTPNQPY